MSFPEIYTSLCESITSSVLAATACQPTLDAIRIPTFGEEEFEARKLEGLLKSRQALTVARNSQTRNFNGEIEWGWDFPPEGFLLPSPCGSLPTRVRRVCFISNVGEASREGVRHVQSRS
ncbi:hypothetical protein CEXT_589511 [Caerostris extrusa]|uniref:Uncharacterized protein n=1 Tax=Caerostris extrusa TaxID=172846 RepID=A0AAV4QEM8_CAEEX|nr:hypothetical protein CEXT_589511 [Caerostris extrusa]